eukprot:TRINITY_DN57134_c0_g1_i1.p1 TRINITY_DN57134_c0_g1~~TRINITY_DN57134_c0_g1_i1.p1  ORF type:complete len:102 (+),score=4.74 TRINITY_DN57134_c0_g1_i1:131-436(+)
MTTSTPPASTPSSAPHRTARRGHNGRFIDTQAILAGVQHLQALRDHCGHCCPPLALGQPAQLPDGRTSSHGIDCETPSEPPAHERCRVSSPSVCPTKCSTP